MAETALFDYRIIDDPLPEARHQAIIEGFRRHHRRDDIKKTHLFNGRYENIYLDSRHIPSLTTLIATATAHAEALTGVEGLRCGFWFNYMPPGAVTTLHRHDDDDERLSGVYYLEVPAHSGELVLPAQKLAGRDFPHSRISPRAGRFVFFPPQRLHEVSRNRSTRARLSVGMNFGRPDARREE